MNGKKAVILHGLILAGLPALLWMLLVLSALIPNEALQKNMEKSALSYKEKAAFSFENGGKLNGISDNYGDTILLNIGWNMGIGNPFLATLDTCYYDGETLGENVGFYLTVMEDGIMPNTDYTRYWHGTAFFVRLLHLFTDVNGMKRIGVAVIFLAAGLTMMLLIRKGHPDLAGTLLLSMAAVQLWNLRLSMEYQPAFVICFLLCPVYLWAERRKEHCLTYLSMAGGVLTSFFDFLTTETVVILLPLILVVAVRAKEGRLGGFMENVRRIALCLICWLLAYGGTFLWKWTAASMAVGENKFILAFSSAWERFGGELPGMEPENPFLRMPMAVAANFTVLFGGENRVEVSRVIVGLFLSVLILGSIFYLLYKRADKTAVGLLAILGCIVFIRYMVLNNHSYLHEFFTYRALISPIMAVLAGMACSMGAGGVLWD